MKLKTLILLSSLLLTSCTVTAQQTGDKDWAVSVKPDGTGVNIQPTKPETTPNTTTSLTPSPSPVISISPSPSPVIIATPIPSFTPKPKIIKPSPVLIATKPVIQPCPKFTYQSPRTSLTLKNGALPYLLC
ncbi:hypothetical protein Cri9333_0573 [Crinalium epipsammum PCC 9333]|uniref:Uncharacterized protein n=1 Tax=Crinalium epipsammum PCC 9333 TaxID=1173022 RepID=K9VTY0_9CYAN|nr:hypothetical protein [Crinalium epipsammum]AFZ11523.1 hypothetical protein Cri9333_0573 [Crinalium epipsammum PCC 9333]